MCLRALRKEREIFLSLLHFLDCTGLLLLFEEKNTMETRYPNRRYQLAGAKVTIIGTLTCPMVERSLLSFVRLYDSVGEGVRFGAFRVLENHYIVLKDKVQSSGINGPKWNRVDTDSLTK